MKVARWFLVGLVSVHGLIHLLGVAKGFGLAEVAALRTPIGPAMAWVWLLAAALMVATAVGLALGRGWWLVGPLAVLASQVAIVTSWSDAAFGTVPNVVLALVAAVGWFWRGPASFPARYRRATAGLSIPSGGLVTENDLTSLPEPLACYLRRVGAVGKPRVTGFRATFHGRIRGGANDPWMPFTGEQVNTYAPSVTRHFLLDATMKGLPVDVLHELGNGRARMRARLLGVVPVADGSGRELDQAETVTLFNDLCLFAPSALLDAPVRWEPLDARRVRGTYTNGDHTVAAVLVFDELGDLVDFISDDRFMAGPAGTAPTLCRWSTPVFAYREQDGRRVCAGGEGRWHPASGSFTYLELQIDGTW